MWTRALSLTALMAVAALINGLAPTLLCEHPLMLGGSVAVLALLLFGWWGLLVGAAALAVAVARGSHPFELLIGLGQLAWLRWFLDHRNGGRCRQGNGRIVLAAIGYWLLLGIPATTIVLDRALGAGLDLAFGLGLKEAVVAVLCTAVGLAAYLLWQALAARGQHGRLSARALTFTAVFLAVSLPGACITLSLATTVAAQAQRLGAGLAEVSQLLTPSFLRIGLLVLVAALLAEALAAAVERVFQGVIRPLLGQADDEPVDRPGAAAVDEVGQLLELLNQRSRRTRKLRRSLRQTSDQLAQTALAITEAIPVGTYTTVLRPGEPEARFSFMSDRFLEICGMQRQALQGMAVGQAFACLHPDDQATFLRLEHEASAERRPFCGQGRVLVDGAVRWVRAESVPRDLADGSTLWEGVLSDVTEQELARQRLEGQQLLLRRILDVLPVAVGINRLEPPQEIVFMNRRFIETFGYSPAELPDVNTWMELAYDDPSYAERVIAEWSAGVESMASGGSLPPMEVRLLCRDRSRREVIISATKLDDLMLVVFLDVTERKQAAAALELASRRESGLKDRQRRELEAKLRTSLTAAAVAHEINQPLSSILINTQMLQAQVEQLAEGETQRTLRPLLELQLRETERVVDTIERMRMLLRNVRTDPQRIDLSEVVESARLVLAGLLSSQGVTVEQSGLDQPQWLLGDSAQLQIAVANLIRNAVEALGQAPVARPLLAISLERRSDQSGNGNGNGNGHGNGNGSGSDWLELRIADNGPGFVDVKRDQLLLSSTKAGGSGIGLFVAATAVENHGGSLVLGRSQSLGGAEVLVRLPALP